MNEKDKKKTSIDGVTYEAGRIKVRINERFVNIRSHLKKNMLNVFIIFDVLPFGYQKNDSFLKMFREAIYNWRKNKAFIENVGLTLEAYLLRFCVNVVNQKVVNELKRIGFFEMKDINVVEHYVFKQGFNSEHFLNPEKFKEDVFNR